MLLALLLFVHTRRASERRAIHASRAEDYEDNLPGVPVWLQEPDPANNGTDEFHFITLDADGATRHARAAVDLVRYGRQQLDAMRGSLLRAIADADVATQISQFATDKIAAAAGVLDPALANMRTAVQAHVGSKTQKTARKNQPYQIVAYSWHSRKQPVRIEGSYVNMNNRSMSAGDGNWRIVDANTKKYCKRGFGFCDDYAGPRTCSSSYGRGGGMGGMGGYGPPQTTDPHCVDW